MGLLLQYPLAFVCDCFQLFDVKSLNVGGKWSIIEIRRKLLSFGYSPSHEFEHAFCLVIFGLFLVYEEPGGAGYGVRLFSGSVRD